MKPLDQENFVNLGIVFNDQGEVLLIRRAKEEIGKNGVALIWAFPGGRQLVGENRNECVEREILVETGYKVQSIREISSRFHPQAQFPIFIVYHFCKLIYPEQVTKPSEPHEIAEIRWVKPEEIRKLITTDLDPQVSKELGLS